MICPKCKGEGMIDLCVFLRTRLPIPCDICKGTGKIKVSEQGHKLDREGFYELDGYSYNEYDQKTCPMCGEVVDADTSYCVSCKEIV